jgi:hypothetical protein
MKAFTEDDLKRVYRAVSMARASGRFGGPHGPLEATAWLHLAVADMERLDYAVGAACVGEPEALAELQTLSRHEPPMHQGTSSKGRDADELMRASVGVADPVALAVSAELLSKAADDDTTKRLMSFAIRRTAALNLVLDATDLYLVGWWSVRRFERVLRDASPLAIGGHAGAGQHGNGHNHHDEQGGAVDDACPCIDHEPLTMALHRQWQGLRDAVHSEAAESMFPASGDASLYERALNRVDARAGRRVVPSVASSVAITGGAHPEPQEAGEGSPRLGVTPIDATVPVGEPVHAWVRLEAIAKDTAVTVEWQYAAPVVVTVKRYEWEALATLGPASATGATVISARVAELGLTALAPISVVRERPTCAPEVGGAWQIAQVEARETFDTCAPAVALGEGAGRLRGQAGKLLTGAYNSAVVGSQLCVKNTNTRVCAREREDNVKKCSEERDEGYNQCTEKRDRGYNRCCDWWPCSWACRAWVWVSNIVCVVWEWVSNVICVAWAWIKNVVCVVWKVVLALGCIVGAIAVGVLKAVAGLVVLVAAIAVAALGKLVRAVCAVFAIRKRDRVTDSLKVVAVHMAMLRSGKVLLMGYDEGVYPVDADNPADFTAVADSDRGLCAIWDPATGKAHYTNDLHRNLFCAHQAFLPDGRLLVASGQFPLPGLLKELLPPQLLAPGADADVHVFDPESETWQRLPDMVFGRWYPTCATMPDGHVLVVSGTNGYATVPGFWRGIQNTWEYADGSGPTGNVTATPFYWFHLFPFVHVLTAGEVFTHAKRTTRLFNPETGKWRRVAPLGPLVMDPGHTPPTGDTVWPFSRTGPGPGTSVLLPLHPTLVVDRPVYPIGRVMILGGGGAEGAPEPEIKDEPYDLHANTPATRTAEILDLAPDTPEWRPTASMANGRVMCDTALLPDGTVLVVGGGRYGRSGGLLAHFASVELEGMADKGALDPVLEPELFDPVTETWRTMCRKPIGRLYHTTAMLLADARVLVAGHDGALNMVPYDRSRYELELFSPPYLFGPNGSPAARPSIGQAPDEITYGHPFEITVSAHISSACLIQPSALTHQINPSQRYVGLVIYEQSHDGKIVFAGAPNANVVPPGWHMLFVVNDAGTPSVAHWLHVRGE